MKKYYLVLLLILLTPSIALASWWNPLTWFRVSAPVPSPAISSSSQKIITLPVQQRVIVDKAVPIPKKAERMVLTPRSTSTQQRLSSQAITSSSKLSSKTSNDTQNELKKLEAELQKQKKIVEDMKIKQPQPSKLQETEPINMQEPPKQIKGLSPATQANYVIPPKPVDCEYCVFNYNNWKWEVSSNLIKDAVTQAQKQIPQQITSSSAKDTVPATISAPMALPPSQEWMSLGRYLVANQFALDSNVRVIATSTFQFTISGRFLELIARTTSYATQKWRPMTNEPLTITYGDQLQTGITDSDGVVKLKFHAIGEKGNHRFTYGSPKYSISDYGTVTENEDSASITVGTLSVTRDSESRDTDISSLPSGSYQIGKFIISASDGDIQVSEIRIEIPQSVIAKDSSNGYGSRRIQGLKIKVDGAYFGVIKSTPDASSLFSSSPFTIKSGQSKTIDVFGDFFTLAGLSTSTETIFVSIQVGGITAVGIPSYQAITAPSSPVTGPKITF